MTVRGEVVYDGMSVRGVREAARLDAPAALRGEGKVCRLVLGFPSA